MKRNIGMYISAQDAKNNILRGLKGGLGTSKSGLAYFAYPGYNFRSPQGAAFSVAKLARQMEDEGLLRHQSRYVFDEYSGYEMRLTPAGEAQAQLLDGTSPIEPVKVEPRT